MFRLITFVLSMALWIVFSGVLDAYHLGLGVLSCAMVAWLSTDLLFSHQELRFGARVAEAGRFLCYGLWLLWEIILANWHVFKLAVFRDVDALSPRIIRFKTSLKTDYARYVFANSITLTPGTVTVSIEGDEFVVHAIDEEVAQSLPGEMEKKVAAVFKEEEGV